MSDLDLTVPLGPPLEGPFCDECTKELDEDSDCFECGTGKYARDCRCGAGDWLCPWHHRHESCQGHPVPA